MGESVLKRRENESEIEFIARAYREKDSLGVTCKELADKINSILGSNYAESTMRSSIAKYVNLGIDIGYEKGLQENSKVDENEVLNELELKKIELKEEKVKLSSLRTDLNKTIRNTARFKQWIDEVKIAIDNVVVEIPNYKGVSDCCNKTDYLSIIADIHTGKKGESLDNYYDLDKLQDRMWKLRDELIEIVKEKKIKTLKILSLGDLIDGLLRCTQLQNLQILRAEQTVFITRFIFEWLNSISEYCYVDFKMTTSANHTESRPLDSKRGDFKSDDYEIIIYEWLSDLCSRNPRIKIEGNSIVEFDLLGRKCVGMHGHQLDKVRGKNMLANINFHMNKQYQYLFIGHLHHTEIKTVGKNELGNQEILYCPCICGNDEYSDTLWTGANAGSLFIEFNDKQGRRSITDIILN